MGENFKGYVSQKGWKDSDLFVECTVECYINGVRHKAVLMASEPMEAINHCQKNFDNIEWKVMQ